MAATGVHVEGLRDKVRALEAAGVEVAELKDVMGGIASTGAEILAGYLPSRTGRLRGTARGNKAKGSAVVTVGRASVPYAGPIIYGWPKRNIHASQAIEQTDRIMETKAVEMLEAGFQTICERHGLA